MTRIEGWTSRHEEVVRSAIRAITGASTDQPRDIAARATQALPVYADLGGCLLLTPAGDVLEYRFEEADVKMVGDSRSIRLARAAAATEYPALADLRPTDGTTCAACEGTGNIGLARARCGECDGTGLVPAGA